MHHRFLISLFIAITFFLSACFEDTTFQPGIDGGASDYSSGPDWGTIVPSCSGEESTITGIVYAPNGVDPVPNATVFIPYKHPELFSAEVRCEACGSLGTENALWSTKTKADGSFSLSGVCPGDRSIVFQNGRFRRFLELTIDPSTTIPISAANSRLPKRTAEFTALDAIPRIAVATGDYDNMECVLRNMGIEVIDLYEAAEFTVSPNQLTPFGELINNLEKMKRYHIIFINCTDNTYENLLSNEVIRKNIADYVDAGGRLYVTDWSYDWIESIPTLSPFIDFEPGASDSQPEGINAAALGSEGIELDATIVDPDLGNWLKNFPNTVHESATKFTSKITHFASNWIMMHDLDSETKLWVEGDVYSTDGSISGTKPLTVTFNYRSCGKILFSSYHTAGRDEADIFFPKPFPNYCNDKFSPQERILEYLIFHIANCVEPVK